MLDRLNEHPLLVLKTSKEIIPNWEFGITKFSVLNIAITASPQDVTNAVGTKINLTCSASGVDNIMYEWMRRGSMISSETTERNANTLVINNIQPGDNGKYRCKASSGGVSVNSKYATVTVLCKLFYSLPPYL